MERLGPLGVMEICRKQSTSCVNLCRLLECIGNHWNLRKATTDCFCANGRVGTLGGYGNLLGTIHRFGKPLKVIGMIWNVLEIIGRAGLHLRSAEKEKRTPCPAMPSEKMAREPRELLKQSAPIGWGMV
jgi:hypothetical protein